MKLVTLVAVAIAATATSGFAQDIVDPYMQAAIDSGVCGDREVRSAVYNEQINQIEVTCEEDVVGLLPLAGGLGPAAAGIGALAAALLGAAGAGGNGPSDTQ